MFPLAPIYLTSFVGSQLKPGDFIIVNQSYGEIILIDDDFIYTSVGKRAFFPNHVYPVFEKVSVEL